MKTIHWIALGAFVGATGCVSFRGGYEDLPKTPVTTSSAAHTVPVSYELVWMVGGTPNPTAAAQQDPLVQSELKDSGLFSDVSVGKSGAYHLDIKVNNHGNIAVAAITGALSGLTLTILPGYARDDFDMDAVLMKDGAKLKSYHYEASMTTWIELFLVFGMPAASPGKAMDETVRQLTRHLVSDIANDHVIQGG